MKIGDGMNHLRTPLLDQLILHSNRHPISFHVPGHKYGEVFPAKGHEFFRPLLQLDATELSGLDDLHSPEGVILESEELLADLYGSRKSYFLVNGSTSGNLAMILTALTEDDVVLVQRNSHKSIMNGIKLAKAKPIYLSPEFEKESMVAGGVNIQTVRNAIEAHPQVKALILTYPNYYGMVNDLGEIINLAHRHGIPVLIDEAHGVHFIAGAPFPSSAISLGADLVVHSAHKTLPAMTMGAYLHYNSSIISEEKLAFYLQALQSSSPSYPIMATLDGARSYLGTYSEQDKDFLMKRIHPFREEIESIPGLTVLPIGNGDPLKMTISSTNGVSGFQLQHLLEEEGIYAELADPKNILFVLPLLKTDMTYPFNEAIRKIKAAASRMTQSFLASPVPTGLAESQLSVTAPAVTYREMETLCQIEVPLSGSEGKICAEAIIPYPPGIPLLLPGEIISSKHIAALEYLQKQGAKLQGGQSLDAGNIKIFYY
ncbi:aminotransferase class I/II-fold pyridoxal phosphate-dependent enzyme [Mesobacillus foraminis]|uniref:aminotransferase class I/II-fold pyridoxal phosphate-dependent enzyme n=1 Tax=Mesobacillus foraminis TaxID=279826 RepID=UPI0039A26627